MVCVQNNASTKAMHAILFFVHLIVTKYTDAILSSMNSIIILKSISGL